MPTLPAGVTAILSPNDQRRAVRPVEYHTQRSPGAAPEANGSGVSRLPKENPATLPSLWISDPRTWSVRSDATRAVTMPTLPAGVTATLTPNDQRRAGAPAES